MTKKTVNQKMDDLSKDSKEKLNQLARDGKSITYIVGRTKLDYAVVQTCLWQNGNLPWQGSKTIITRRLNSLRHATKRQNRDELIEAIKEQIDYLYYAARQLAAEMDKVRRSLPRLSH